MDPLFIALFFFIVGYGTATRVAKLKAQLLQQFDDVWRFIK